MTQREYPTLPMCLHGDGTAALKAVLRRRNQAEVAMDAAMVADEREHPLRIAYREAADEAHQYARCRECQRYYRMPEEDPPCAE